MNLKLGLVGVLSLGILSGCAFRNQAPASNVPYVAPEPVVFDAPFAPSPQYAATLEGGPHYTEGPELRRWAPKDVGETVGKGRGLPAPVNAKEEADDAGDGAAVSGQGAPSGGAVVAVTPPPVRRPPTIERQSTAPGGTWTGPSTGRAGDPASASSF